jgi:hypothetical protein
VELPGDGVGIPIPVCRIGFRRFERVSVLQNHDLFPYAAVQALLRFRRRASPFRLIHGNLLGTPAVNGVSR